MLLYFQTPKLANTTHIINITVTAASETNKFAVDYFLVTNRSDGFDPMFEISHASPSLTQPIVAMRSALVGVIVGGVVGGIAGIAILSVALWYFLKRRPRGRQTNYFEKPAPSDLAAECL